jgi:hypothetical protein
MILLCSKCTQKGVFSVCHSQGFDGNYMSDVHIEKGA